MMWPNWPMSAIPGLAIAKHCSVLLHPPPEEWGYLQATSSPDRLGSCVENPHVIDFISFSFHPDTSSQARQLCEPTALSIVSQLALLFNTHAAVLMTSSMRHSRDASSFKKKALLKSDQSQRTCRAAMFLFHENESRQHVETWSIGCRNAGLPVVASEDNPALGLRQCLDDFKLKGVNVTRFASQISAGVSESPAIITQE